MKTFFIVIAVIALAAGGYVIHAQKVEEEEFQALLDSEPSASLTVNQLTGHVKGDSLSAEREYNKKLLDLTGPVRSADADEDEPSVVLGQGSSSIRCVFTDSSGLSRLNEGDVITIRGVALISESDVTMDCCRLID